MDLISRQAAIDAVKSFDILDGYTDQQELIYRIRQLPSAQPEPLTEAEVIICKMYLDDLDKHKTCNEYKLLMGLLDGTASAQPEPQWIPVSERLPEDRVDVLVCYRYWQQYAKRYVYTIVNGWYAHKYSVKENIFSEWEQDCDYKEDEDEYYIQEGWYEFTTHGNSDLYSWYIGDAEVVAWMPLPEPYREDGGE